VRKGATDRFFAQLITDRALAKQLDSGYFCFNKEENFPKTYGLESPDYFTEPRFYSSIPLLTRNVEGSGIDFTPVGYLILLHRQRFRFADFWVSLHSAPLIAQAVEMRGREEKNYSQEWLAILYHFLATSHEKVGTQLHRLSQIAPVNDELRRDLLTVQSNYGQLIDLCLANPTEYQRISEIDPRLRIEEKAKRIPGLSSSPEIRIIDTLPERVRVCEAVFDCIVGSMLRNVAERPERTDDFEIELALIEDKGKKFLQVRDESTGAPVDPEVKKVLDRQTGNAPVSSKKSNHGGLGLFISRRLLNLVGGTLLKPTFLMKDGKEMASFGFRIPIW
jgi:hypothetical protein